MSDYQYQSFDDAAGMVDSYDKLLRAKLPIVHGLHVLDIGCNEGYFCGVAKKAGATRVLGIDSFGEMIERAARRFPDCEFQCRDWFHLPEEKFDLVLFLASLHYLGTDESIARMFANIRDCLSIQGLFILETGVSNNDRDEFQIVKRADETTVYYPSFAKLHRLAQAAGLGYRVIGVTAEADGVKRYSLHLKKFVRPVLLVKGRPAAGKTRLAEGITRFEDDFLVKTDDIAETLAAERGVDPENVRNNLPRVFDDNLDHFADEVLTRTVAKINAKIAALQAQGKPVQIPLVVDGYLPETLAEALEDIVRSTTGSTCWHATTMQNHGSPWDLPGARVSIDGMLYAFSLGASAAAMFRVEAGVLHVQIRATDAYRAAALRCHFLDAANRTVAEHHNSAQVTRFEVPISGWGVDVRAIRNVAVIYPDGGVSFVDYARSDFQTAVEELAAQKAKGELPVVAEPVAFAAQASPEGAVRGLV